MPLHRYLDVSVSVGKMSTNRPKNADGVSSARAAGLRYANPDAPGISRKRRGKSFVYLDARGRQVRDAKTLERIRALVLPPAWTDVWISTDPRAHLQATGRDAAGRKQYRYHAHWTVERDSTKYHRMLAFADVLPAIRKRTRRDLMGRAHCRPRVLATVVELLARTYIRIGNEEYTRANKSHGLTTLRDRHVKVRGRKLSFAFRGKSGVFQEIEIEEPRLALAVRQCQDLPGQTLFQYLDESDQPRTLTSSDINSYLREVTGGKFTAKDFRTWAGTLSAAQALDGMETPASKSAANKLIIEAVDRVADVLGNTRSVCRKCYIHPAVLTAFTSGVTLSTVTINKSRVPKGLLDPEARLVVLLRRPDRVRKAA